MIIYTDINNIYDKKLQKGGHSSYLSHFSNRAATDKVVVCGSLSNLLKDLANAGPQENPFVPNPLNMAADGMAG